MCKRRACCDATPRRRRRRRGAAYPRDWSLDDGDASSQEVRHAENNSGTPRTHGGEFLVRAPSSYVLTTTRDAIFMEPRAGCVYEFFICIARRLIVQHLPSFSDFRRLPRNLSSWRCLRTPPKLAIDGIDLFRGELEGEARAKRRKKVCPFVDRALMNHTPRCLRPTE